MSSAKGTIRKFSDVAIQELMVQHLNNNAIQVACLSSAAMYGRASVAMTWTIWA